jgi:RNA polymerase sigma-70 factor (ECF subfamily)
LTDWERTLAHDLQRGDPVALERLVSSCAGHVLHLVKMILGGAGFPEDAEEVAADAFARVWQRRAEYDPDRASLRSWVLMIAKFTALDRRRQLLGERYTQAGELRVLPLASAPEPPVPVRPEDEVLRQERDERLYRALMGLSAGDRDLLMRRYLLGESVAGLASAYGVTRNAMDVRLWRARRALQAELEGGKEGEKDDEGAV